MTTYAADKFPIKITQGDDWNYPVTFSTSLNGVKTPIDLTAATVTGVVRPTYTSGTAVTMSVLPVDLSAGKVALYLTSAQTASLPTGALVYDISLTISGKTKTYVSGIFNVRPEVKTV